MKLRKVSWRVAGFLGVSACLFASMPLTLFVQIALNDIRFDRLSVGMHQDEVSQCLGEPDFIAPNARYEQQVLRSNAQLAVVKRKLYYEGARPFGLGSVRWIVHLNRDNIVIGTYRTEGNC